MEQYECISLKLILYKILYNIYIKINEHTYQNTPTYSLKNQNIYARLVNVHDGDTITCIIESYPKCFFKYNIRLNNIDACEITTKDSKLKQQAIIARNHLIEFLTGIILDDKHIYTRNDIIDILSKDAYLVYLKCDGMDKYGRVLADVYNIENLNKSASEYLRELYPESVNEYHGGHKAAFYT